MPHKPIADCHPPLSVNDGHPRMHTIPRTDTDDPARAAVIDRFCHCHPVTQELIRCDALRREIVDLAEEYYRVNRAWLMAQLRAWELAGTSSADLTRRKGMAVDLGAVRDEILRKLRDKCRALGMRSQK